MKRMLTNRKGFSIIELLIAVSILAVGLLATAGMQGMAINSNRIANVQSVATSLANDALEQMLTLKSTHALLNTNAVNALYDLNPDPAQTTISYLGTTVYSATYSVAIDSPITNIVTIVITVFDGNGNSLVTLTGYKRV